MLTNFKFDFCIQTTETKNPNNTLPLMTKNTETEIRRMLKETAVFLDQIKNNRK